MGQGMPVLPDPPGMDGRGSRYDCLGSRGGCWSTYSRMSNESEAYVGCKIQFPNYPRPLILFNKMEGMMT